MKRQNLEAELWHLGWNLLRNGRKHDVWSNGQREIAAPRHREINEYTAKAVLKEAKGYAL